ncbi:13541_t:CDS:1, partial [Entrophospora sp. SA101]
MPPAWFYLDGNLAASNQRKTNLGTSLFVYIMRFMFEVHYHGPSI